MRLAVLMLSALCLAACESAPPVDCHPLAFVGDSLARCRASEFTEVVPPKELLTARDGLSIQAGAITGVRVPDEFWPAVDAQLNRPVDAAFDLITSITSGHLPSVSGETATWETVPSLTERVIWRLTARKLPSVGSAFTFVVEGRPVNGPPSSYLPVMYGTREILPDGDSDTGSLVVLWENASRLPDHDQKSPYQDGTMAVSYSQTANGRRLEGAVFRGTSGVLKNGVGAVVSLTQDAPGAGELTYAATYNVDAPAKRWSGTGHIRWTSSGAARADFFQHSPPAENRGDVYWGMCANPQGKRVLTITEGGNTVGAPTNCAFPEAAYFMP